MAGPAWSLKLVTGPAAEPVDLELLKLALRVESGDENAWVNLWGKAARQAAEQYLGRSLLPQTWRLSLDRFPGGDDGGPVYDGDRILLPMPPVTAVSSVAYLDTDGASAAVLSADYRLNLDAEPAWLEPAYGEVWPSTYLTAAAVTITYAAGHTSAEAVPAAIRSAVAFGAAWLYEYRGDDGAELPRAFYDLLRPYKVGTYF